MPTRTCLTPPAAAQTTTRSWFVSDWAVSHNVVQQRGCGSSQALLSLRSCRQREKRRTEGHTGPGTMANYPSRFCPRNLDCASNIERGSPLTGGSTGSLRGSGQARSLGRLLALSVGSIKKAPGGFPIFQGLCVFVLWSQISSMSFVGLMKRGRAEPSVGSQSWSSTGGRSRVSSRRMSVEMPAKRA